LVDSQQLGGGTGGIVKKASKATVVAVMLFIVSLAVVLTAGIIAVWLTEEVRVLGLMILPTAIVASLLVVYFDWRAKLLDRLRDERHEYRTAG
jgi:hypothetical protein